MGGSKPRVQHLQRIKELRRGAVEAFIRIKIHLERRRRPVGGQLQLFRVLALACKPEAGGWA